MINPLGGGKKSKPNLANNQTKQKDQENQENKNKSRKKLNKLDNSTHVDIADVSVRKDGSHDKDSTGDTGMMYGKVATHKLRKFIVSSILQPTYVEDIRDVLKGRYRWRKVAMITYIMHVVIAFVASALMFYSAYDNSPLIGLIAGIVNLLGTAFVSFSQVAKNESKRQTHQVNEILRQLGIDGVPDIDDDKVDKQIDKNDDTGNGNGTGTGVDNLNKELREITIDKSKHENNKELQEIIIDKPGHESENEKVDKDNKNNKAKKVLVDNKGVIKDDDKNLDDLIEDDKNS